MHCLFVGAVFCILQGKGVAFKSERGSSIGVPLLSLSSEHNSQRVAVLIAGCRDRLIWKSKVERVVEPLILQGFHVDFFLDLVEADQQSNSVFSPIPGSTDAQIDFDHLNKTLTDAGARLAHLHLHGRLDVEKDYPTQEYIEKHLRGRIWSYSPFSNGVGHSMFPSGVGRNILRRFKATASLMESVEREERQSGAYGYVLWAKDDGYWLNSLRMSSFARPGDQNMVFSQNCLTFGGINDRSLLFGRKAAGAMLMHVYSDFFQKEKPLNSFNSEAYWLMLSKLYGVTSVTVEPTALASLNSAIKNGTLCQRQICTAAYSEPAKLCSTIE